MDIVAILGFGLSGLSFLLFVLSFRLISQEQKQPQPRSGILKMILFFMVLTLVSTVTVGWFGIVQNKTGQLSSKNDSLAVAQASALTAYINLLNKQNQEKVETIKTGDKKEIVAEIKDLQNNADTLAKSLAVTNPEQAEEVQKSGDTIQVLLSQIKKTSASDTAKIKMLSNKVLLANSRIKTISATAVSLNKENLRFRKFGN